MRVNILQLFSKVFLFLLLSITLYAHTDQLTDKEKEWIKNNPVITVQNEQDWEPFNYNLNGTPKGHSIDFIKLLVSKVGLEVEFTQGYSWKEYLEMLKKGELDALVNIAKTPQREKLYSYTQEYHKVLSSLYMLEKDIGKYDSLKDLEGKTVSVVEGMVGESVLRKNYPKINIYPAKTSLDALKAVIYGKADGVVQSNLLGNRLIHQYQLNDLKPVFEINDQKFNMHLHLATNKQNKILKDILQKGILQISQNELLELQEKHFNFLKKTNLYLSKQERNWLKNNPSLSIGVPPFQAPILINEKENLEGIIPEYLQLVSKILGVDFEIKVIDRKEVKTYSTSDSKLDAILTINTGDKQKNRSTLSTKEILDFPIVIASLENKPIYNGLNDRNLKRLAIAKFSPLTKKIKQVYPDIELIPVVKCMDGLDKLLENKADAYICSPNVIAHTLRSFDIHGIVISSISPYRVGFNLEVKQENQILHSILNKAIDSISTYDTQMIKKRWQQVELHKLPDYSSYIQTGVVFIIIVVTILIWISWWNKRLRFEIKAKEIAQKDALEKERRLSTLLDNIPGMAYRAKNEPSWPMIDVNHAAYGLTGYTKEEFMTQAVLYNNLIVKSEREHLCRVVQEAINHNIDYYIEYQIITKSGEKKWVWERGKPLFRDDGKLLCLEGLIVDNSYVKEKEEESTLFKYIADSSLDHMSYIDSTYTYRAVNQAYLDSHGKRRDEIVGSSVAELLGRDIFNSFVKEKLDICLTGERVVYENWFEFKEDKKRYMYVTYYPYQSDNKTIGIVVVAKDNTKQKQAEDELKESEQKLRTLIDTIPDMVWMKDMEGIYKFANLKYQEFLDLSEKEIIGKTDYQLYDKDQADFYRMYDKLAIEAGEPKSNEEEAIYTNGEVTLLETVKVPVYDANSEIIGVIGIGRDISELRKKEEMLISQSRSAAMGDMISMIAHQWKQPLSALSMVANNMKVDYELDSLNSENMEKYHADIDRQVQHLATTIDDFRDFFKPNKTKQTVLVQNVIDDTLKIIDKSLENNNIELIKDFKDVGEVSIFSNELFHILLNIVNNAKEALIYRDIKERKLYISTFKNSKNIYIEVEDNAGGIDEQIIDRIFEPYFTTKGELNGTGIGLYMAKTIIEKHFMGKIEVQNSDLGAKFRLIIPKSV